MKTMYVSLGPMPLELIVPVLTQCAEQGWTKDDILFGGMGVAQTRISLPGMNPKGTPMPLYIMLVTKEFPSIEDFVPPTINLSGVSP